MSVLHETDAGSPLPITTFGPDFPFAYDTWISHPSGLGRLPAAAHGSEVAVIGAGLSGIIAAHELMKLGLRPVVYEADRMGGRLRSEPFHGGDGVIAELGGMRFPVSSTGLYHYIAQVGIETRPFPNPLDEATLSTLVDLEGEQVYVEGAGEDGLPPLLQEVADAWRSALENGASFSALQAAVRRRDVAALKEIWNRLVPLWDERTFYDFIASSAAFAEKSFRHREVFGQVGFGTGGWDSDFPNSMLEILRVVVTAQDDHQRMMVGGAEQLPRRLWRLAPTTLAHWPAGTSLASLHGGAPRAGVARIARGEDGRLAITDRWGDTRGYDAAIVTCHSWLLTTQIDCDERLFSHKLWMALDRTRYMQSSKTFVMVDRPFWSERDPATGRYKMSMTLTDRITARHLPFRQRAGQARGDLPVLFLDDGCHEGAAAGRRQAGAADAEGAAGDLSGRRHRAPHHRRPDHGIVGKRPPIFLAPSRAPCPGTIATTAGCSASSSSATCRPISATCFWPATAFPSPPPGRRARCRRRSTPYGACCTSWAGKLRPITRGRATCSTRSPPSPCRTDLSCP